MKTKKYCKKLIKLRKICAIFLDTYVLKIFFEFEIVQHWIIATILHFSGRNFGELSLPKIS